MSRTIREWMTPRQGNGVGPGVRCGSGAPTHDASPAVRELAARIIVAQRDEIAFMRRSLRDDGQQVPDADTARQARPIGVHPR